MRFIYGAAAAGTAVAIQFIAPVVLMGASPARADIDGYRRCVGNLAQLPLQAPDPKRLQLAGLIQQDLNSCVPPVLKARKLAQRGFEPATADAIVQCVMQEHP